VKLKTDENIGRAGIELLRERGHDVSTVREQGLAGAPDNTIFSVSSAERRTLVTLDRDFGQTQRFPPKSSAGVVVLALGGTASIKGLQDRLRDFLALAATRPVEGELWIVEPGRVRVHLDRADDDR
jgi:predicted nuclease of predicted toxin-antitoxin system